MSEPTTVTSPVTSVGPRLARECHARFGVYPACPLCDGELHAEHAHFKCASCGWRDSCCD